MNKKFETIIYVKAGTRGAYVEELSNFKNQREFLLNKGLYYMVLSKTDSLMELEVIT